MQREFPGLILAAIWGDKPVVVEPKLLFYCNVASNCRPGRPQRLLPAGGVKIWLQGRRSTSTTSPKHWPMYHPCLRGGACHAKLSSVCIRRQVVGFAPQACT